MSDADRWLNKVQFAAAEGCDEKQVRRGLASGKLVARDDGKLDRAQVGSGWRRPRVDSRDPPTAAGAASVRQLRRAEIVKRLEELDWTRTFDWGEEAMRIRAVNAAAAIGMQAVLSELRDDGHFGGYQLRDVAILRRRGLCIEAVRAGYGFELDEADVLHELRAHLHHCDDGPEDMNDLVDVRLDVLPLLAYPFHDRHRPPAEMR